MTGMETKRARGKCIANALNFLVVLRLFTICALMYSV